jgi:L-rhamnose-H+ transport protein
MQQLIGIILHAIGGFSSASFYVPSHLLRKWAWHTYWITLGLVAWIIMPWVGGWLTTTDLSGILSTSPSSSLTLTYLFGILWGFGGLMAGLGLRYLGLALGQSICLGVSAIVGTLVPAIIDHKAGMLVSTGPGAVISAGFITCVAGIVFCGYAGVLKDRQLSDEQKKVSVKEFSAAKGLLMAVLGGVMSACMAFAIKAGAPIAAAAIHAGTATVFCNNPIFVLALAGGFTTNAVYVLIISYRKKTFGDYTLRPGSTLARNYLLALLSGIMWYGQFFFYGMGTTKMGKYDFASWSIHMSSIIIFSNLWGLWLKEWRAVGKSTLIYLWLGILLLIISVVLIGIGNYLAA